MIRTLENAFLGLDIADITSYQGARFDKTGFITQVRLKHADGFHTFCTFEKTDPDRIWSGGAGLCNEFGLFAAIGYEEAQIGELFPKIGVGLLTKPDESPYDFSRAYEIRPFEMDCDQGEDYVQYVVHPMECRGYAVRMSKRISLEQSQIIVDYELENVGSKAIATSEYVHNFLSINHQPIGPDYRLKFNVPMELKQMEEAYSPRVLEVGPEEIRWKSSPEQPFYCQFKRLQQPEQEAGQGQGQEPVRWELLYLPEQIGVWEQCHSPVSTIALWGAAHVVSPELFIDLQLEPGQRAAWTRRFGFFQQSQSQRT
ncbi:hypothetical protein [Paenibacillus turpanensis]|uniref:hypothetical protein n=1 Tax=Paenibacillus turpanensis TaxID=2689078 RepID=UPI001408D0B0|nr:hypothetical protein [Paenibacillus turpanensis]